jgi:lipopolysaccharide export LptBFGC system permease protein LptF
MKTIIRSILTLSLVTAVLALASCQSSGPPASNEANVRPFNMSGITPR